MIQFKTKRGQLGLIRTNIAYVLVDAAHSLLMDAQDDFKAGWDACCKYLYNLPLDEVVSYICNNAKSEE